ETPASGGDWRDGLGLSPFAKRRSSEKEKLPSVQCTAKRNRRTTGSQYLRWRLQVETGRSFSAATRSGGRTALKCDNSPTRCVGRYARNSAELRATNQRRVSLFRRHARASERGLGSRPPDILHWNCHVQKRRSRASSRCPSPTRHIHGRNRLPLSGAWPISRETVRAGAHATRRGIDRGCARHFSGRSRARDNCNSRRVFPIRSRMKIESAVRALAVIIIAASIASCVAPDTRHQIVISARDQKLALLDRSNVMAIYPVSTSKYGLGDWLGSSCTPLGKLEIAK